MRKFWIFVGNFFLWVGAAMLVDHVPWGKLADYFKQGVAVTTSSISAVTGPTRFPGFASELPLHVGDCVNTKISSIGSRLQGDPQSGSAVNFQNGGFQVGYDMDPAIQESNVGDSVRMCLVSIPENCPAGDNRGRVYRTTNLRTHNAWERADSSHECGGA